MNEGRKGEQFCLDISLESLTGVFVFGEENVWRRAIEI
jgi:hypothetical protein